MNKTRLILPLLTLFVASCDASVGGGTYYTVTFDSDGGSVVESIRVKEGERIPLPADPTLDHADFSGWTLMSGTVQVDKTVTIVDGEEEDWTQAYLGGGLSGDYGPYLAFSDLTFKAVWSPETTSFLIKYGNGYLNEENAAIVSDAIQSYVFEGEYYTEIIIEKDSGSLAFTDALLLGVSSGNVPSLFINRWEIDSEEGTYQYRNEVERRQRDIDSLCAPLSDQDSAWVKSNFAFSSYEDMLIDGSLYGFPLYTRVYGERRVDYLLSVSKYERNQEVAFDIAKHISNAFVS